MVRVERYVSLTYGYIIYNVQLVELNIIRVANISGYRCELYHSAEVYLAVTKTSVRRQIGPSGPILAAKTGPFGNFGPPCENVNCEQSKAAIL